MEQKKFKDVYEFLEKTQDMEPMQIGTQIFWLSEEQIVSILSQKNAVQEDGDSQSKKPIASKEKKEVRTTVLPWAVAKQQQESTEYFTTNNETNHLAVITHIQELTKQKKISYVDTGKGTYTVNFNLPWCNMQRYMPEDETIGDSQYEYTLRDESNFTKNETTKAKLQSEEGKKHLKEKEQKENKKLFSKAEILKLWKSLYPSGTQEEQILSIMQATGFYGWMRLSDIEDDYQLAVICCRESFNRKFHKMNNDYNVCSLVYTAAV